MWRLLRKRPALNTQTESAIPARADPLLPTLPLVFDPLFLQYFYFYLSIWIFMHYPPPSRLCDLKKEFPPRSCPMVNLDECEVPCKKRRMKRRLYPFFMCDTRYITSLFFSFSHPPPSVTHWTFFRSPFGPPVFVFMHPTKFIFPAFPPGQLISAI